MKPCYAAYKSQMKISGRLSFIASIVLSITISRGFNLPDCKMCIAGGQRKMRRTGSGYGNKPIASARPRSVAIAIFCKHSTPVRSIIIIPASHQTNEGAIRRL
jgi:hypothetical protein